MKKSLSFKGTIPIGLMLFATFFGAGNMILPPELGQMSGTNIWIASLGFIASGVGLSLLAIAAISLFDGDIGKLTSRIHPACAVIIPLIIYLAIGPFFAVPRTGIVSYEMAMSPWLNEGIQGRWDVLFLFTLLYFSITFYLSLNPSKLVDIIGKYMTPVLLLIIGVIVVKAIITPIGPLSTPSQGYEEAAFFKGFTKGFLTMDALGAFVLGGIIINAIKEKGIKSRTAIAKSTIIAGCIAAIGLTGIYLSLAYIGATSIELGKFDNGAALLAAAVQHLFGDTGLFLLGIAILFACLTTSIGLVSACGKFFAVLLPNFSYSKIVFIICLFSFSVSNLGLSTLIKISVPVLVIMYPVAVVLIILAFLDSLIGGKQAVYVGAVMGSLLVSIVQGLESAGLANDSLLKFMQKIPLYTEGMGWLLLAILGGIIGLLIPKGAKDSSEQFKNIS
ncbi:MULTISPECIES: branched-chain amino acid transport system II carrier protein [unclassified Bacillus cereus group]|uniref:branched-chain amino acid transport system II carrier protein n=1 Tax=unclassified Bacillus cereus group TaxID=2750818 RepID=UPI003396B46F